MEFWSYVPNRVISTMFENAFVSEGCKTIDASELVRKARRVKSLQEITYTEKAMEICDIGHQVIVNELREGITELELYGNVMAKMIAAGGEFPALIPVFNAAKVVDGKVQSTGHSMASHKPIKKGTVLWADLFGVFHRYHANALRGYYLGDDAPQVIVDQYRRAGGVFDVFKTDIRGRKTRIIGFEIVLAVMPVR